MTAEGWRSFVAGATAGSTRLEQLVRLLVEVDEVKAKLNAAGISWAGRSLRDAVDEMIRDRRALDARRERLREAGRKGGLAKKGWRA